MSVQRKLTSHGRMRVPEVRSRSGPVTIEDIERVALAFEQGLVYLKEFWTRSGNRKHGGYHRIIGNMDVDHVMTFMFKARILTWENRWAADGSALIGHDVLDHAALARWKAKAALLARDGHIGWRLDQHERIRRAGRIVRGR